MTWDVQLCPPELRPPDLRLGIAIFVPLRIQGHCCPSTHLHRTLNSFYLQHVGGTLNHPLFQQYQTTLWLIVPLLAMATCFSNYPICDSCNILCPGIDMLAPNIQNRPSHCFLIGLTGWSGALLVTQLSLSAVHSLLQSPFTEQYLQHHWRWAWTPLTVALCGSALQPTHKPISQNLIQGNSKLTVDSESPELCNEVCHHLVR